MDGREDDQRKLRIDRLASLASDPELATEERLRSRCAEADENAWLDDGELRLEPWAAGRDLRLVRLLVDPALPAGLPLEVFDDVRDIGE
jgi:hypothetical protein